MTLFLIISYVLLIFNYVFMRIYRDKLLQMHISLLASSPCKILAYLFIIIFVYINKKLYEKYTWRLNLIYLFIFQIFLVAFYFNLFAEFNFSPKNIYFLMINKYSVVLFYIISEVLSVFVSMNFFNICNSIINKKTNTDFYKNLFIYSQIGLFAASLILFFIPNLSLEPLLITFSLLFYLFLKFPKEIVNRPAQNTQNTYGKKESFKTSNFLIFIIPLMTICCGFLAGIIDPYTKFLTNSLVYNDSKAYGKLLALFWIIQSILSLGLGFIFKYFNYSSFFITPFFIFIVLIILLCFKSYFSLKILTLIFIFLMIFFKSLKYSLHSPAKEIFINNSVYSKEILNYEGYFGKLGKNSTAIILSGLWSMNFTWNSIDYYCYIVILCVSLLWIFLSNKINSLKNK